MKDKLLGHSQGQAVVIIALMAIGMIAMLGLVFDGGNAYLQRRRMQNAADAAVLAGGRQLALARSSGNANEVPIISAINNYLTYNGADPLSMTAFYINATGGTVGQVGVNGVIPGPANGLRVTASTSFKTYFLGVVNINTGNTSAPASILTGQPTQVSNLFPVVVPTNTLVSSNPGDYQHCQYNLANNPSCLIWGDKQAAANGDSGSSGWTSFHICSPDAGTLQGLINGTIPSGNISIPDSLCSTTGVKSSMADALYDVYLKNEELIVPIFCSTNGAHGSSLQYNICAFAVFKITGYSLSGNNPPGTAGDQSCGGTENKFICGKFVRFAASATDIDPTKTCTYGFCGFKMTE